MSPLCTASIVLLTLNVYSVSRLMTARSHEARRVNILDDEDVRESLRILNKSKPTKERRYHKSDTGCH